MMFGRKKKVLAAYASSLATLINTTFWPLRQLHGGELPPEVTSDKFILGYIRGVIQGGATSMGLETADQLDLIVQVYEMLFPEQGRELYRLSQDWAKNEMEDTQNMTPTEARKIIKQSKGKVLLTAFGLGDEESVPYHKAQREYMTGNTDMDFEELGKSLHSLEEHLDREYIQPGRRGS